jgi:hypothetical protein
MSGTEPTVSRSALRAQQALVAVGVLALIVLLVAIGLQIAATFRTGAPARVVETTAGPYALTVSLYHDPAQAGYALPFAIAPQAPVAGKLTYTVMSVPGEGVDATPVNAGLSPDPSVSNGVVGTVEVTVRGPWSLHVTVDGPQGPGTADVPITAEVPAVLPTWIAWPLGLIPAIGIAWFLIAQRRARTSERTASATTPARPENAAQS